MEPEVIAGRSPEGDAHCVEVHTYPKPEDPAKTIAMVTAIGAGSHDVTFTFLVDRQEMSHDEAMRIGLDHARRCGIPRVYEQRR